MSLIYPDNQNRANRVAALATNIGSIQQEVLDAIARIDKKGDDISKTMDAILAKSGLKTIDEMKTKLMALMTPEEWQGYQDQVAELRGHNATLDKILDASLMVAFISGSAGIVVRPITLIINTGALAATTELLSRGFGMLLRGEEGAAGVMAAAIRTGRRLAEGVELTEEAAKFVRYFRAVSFVLSILGVVLDGVILIYEAIEGERQRDELRKGITSLFCRRFQAKELEDNILATESHHAEVEAYLTTYNVLISTPNLPQATIDQVLEGLTIPIVDGVKSDLALITDDSVWAQLVSMDSMGGAWRDEDPPNVAAVVAWINAQPATA